MRWGARVLPPADGTGAAPAPAAAGPAGSTLAAAPWFWLVSLSIIAADQFAKWLVRIKLPLYGSQAIIPGLLDVVHVHNAGVAFGFLNDSARPHGNLVTAFLAVAALVGIGYYA